MRQRTMEPRALENALSGGESAENWGLWSVANNVKRPRCGRELGELAARGHDCWYPGDSSEPAQHQGTDSEGWTEEAVEVEDIVGY